MFQYLKKSQNLLVVTIMFGTKWTLWKTDQLICVVQGVLLAPTPRQNYKLGVYRQLLTIPTTLYPGLWGHTSFFARVFVQTLYKSLINQFFSRYAQFSECCWLLLQGRATSLVSMYSCLAIPTLVYPVFLCHTSSFVWFFVQT